MSGHSHWAGIKHKKEVTDQKRGKIFSKLLAAVSVAAKSEPNPDFNPRLRTAIAKAREASVPQENIERAVKRASETSGGLEELMFEAYGPGGAAILVTAVSDNRNRTIQEIKNILKEHGGKWAEAGSVRWAFEEIRSREAGRGKEGKGEVGMSEASAAGTDVGEVGRGRGRDRGAGGTTGAGAGGVGAASAGAAGTIGDGATEGGWQAKFPQEISREDGKKLAALVAALEENDDVQKVFTNATAK